MARSLTGTRIRERRRSKQLSQTELARQVGISSSYLNLIEHNRRGIAGKTLLAIADRLGVDARSLSEGADRAHIMQLREAAAETPEAAAETDRVEEFIGRFPGWARLVDRTHAHTRFQTESLMALSDRLNHDPFFAEAMHMMLSNITAIHSTADILVEEELPQEMRQMFMDNLSAESHRLAQTASELIGHFETPAEARRTTGQSSLIDSFFEARGFYLGDLESGARGIEDYLAEVEPETEFELQELKKALLVHQEVVQALPLAPFLERCDAVGFDPLRLAADYGVPLELVLRRLAQMPRDESGPQFGYLEIDGSGGVLLRKELPSLNLPRFSSGCPLWPVYRSLGQPGQPVRAMMNAATGDSFLTYSIARQQPINDFGLPPSLTATMVFTADFDAILPKAERRSLPHLDVGLHCSVCPRPDCSARRSGYILG